MLKKVLGVEAIPAQVEQTPQIILAVLRMLKPPSGTSYNFIQHPGSMQRLPRTSTLTITNAVVEPSFKRRRTRSSWHVLRLLAEFAKNEHTFHIPISR
jgi:hypothetical protein